MMDDNSTMTLGSVQTSGRWRQYFAKLLQGRVTTLADLRARSTSVQRIMLEGRPLYRKRGARSNHA